MEVERMVNNGEWVRNVAAAPTFEWGAGGGRLWHRRAIQDGGHFSQRSIESL